VTSQARAIRDQIKANGVSTFSFIFKYGTHHKVTNFSKCILIKF